MEKINKSSSRTLDIIELLSKSTNGLTLNEIYTTLKLPKSSTFEIVKSMLFKGYLEVSNDKLRTYKLSIKLFEIGMSYLSTMDLPKQAKPYLEELNKLSGGTAFLGIEDNGKVVYLDKAENYSHMRPTAKLGARKLLHCTSLGKALLAGLSNDDVIKILKSQDLVSRTPYTKNSIVEIIHDLEEVRKRGYSIDNREDNIEMFCVGAPIYNASNAVIAAISCANIYSSMTPEKIVLVSKLVKETAMSISKKLGFINNKFYI